MRDVYSDGYDSVVAGGPSGLVPETVKRFAAAALFVGLVGSMGVWAYRLGTRDAGEVPIIRAMEGPARIAPADPGGLQAAHQGLEVNSVLAAQPAPAPREVAVAPVPEPLAAEDAPQGELLRSVQAAMVQRAMEDSEAELAAIEVAPSVEDTVAALEEDDALEPSAEAAEQIPLASGPRPMGRPKNLAAAPRATSVASRPSAVAEPREVASLPAGSRMVQLGAYDSAELTRAAWSDLVKRHGDILGDKSLYVERATSNARVFYRLRVAGFDNTDQTRVMCEELRAQGVDCIPVTLQ